MNVRSFNSYGTLEYRERQVYTFFKLTSKGHELLLGLLNEY